MAGDFLNVADKTTFAKCLIGFQICAQTWPERWWKHIMLGTEMQLEKADAERLVASYKPFSDQTLVVRDEGLAWIPPDLPPP